MVDTDSDAAKRLGLDTSRPNIARVYDYWLGGRENFEADRAEAVRLLRLRPDASRLSQDNREFLRRAVGWLAADRGIRQFLDVGSGLPTARNTHEVAQASAPDSRIAYVDKDPVVVLHAGSLLADGHNVIAVHGDTADPAAILTDPRVSALIHSDEPCAVILTCLLHFFPPDAARRIVTEFARLTPPGSYLVVSVSQVSVKLAPQYKASEVYCYDAHRTRALLSGLNVIDPPGLVDVRDWEPGIPETASSQVDDDLRILAAVAQTP